MLLSYLKHVRCVLSEEQLHRFRCKPDLFAITDHFMMESQFNKLKHEREALDQSPTSTADQSSAAGVPQKVRFVIKSRKCKFV